MLHSYLCGVDRLTGQIKGFPFEPAAPSPVPGAAGTTQSVQFNKVESYEQLSSVLSVDARAEARFGLFDADASFSFEKSMSINSYSIFVYAVANVQRGFEQVVEPHYRPEAGQLLTQGGGAAAFRAAYGDWFVRGMATGGQLLSLIEIRTRDQTQRQRIDTSLSGSYGYSFSGETDSSSSFNSAVGETTTNIVKHQVGGTPQTIQKPEDVFPALEAFVNELAATNCTTAVPYQVGCVSYETVPLPGGPPLVDVQQAEEVLDVLARLRKDYLRVLADIQYVLTNQEEFDWQDKPKEVAALNEASHDFAGNLATVQRHASALARDVTASVDGLQALEDLPDYALPPRKQGEAPPEERAVSAEPTNLKDVLVRSRMKSGMLGSVTASDLAPGG